MDPGAEEEKAMADFSHGDIEKQNHRQGHEGIGRAGV
jgi:hypothetical protein